MNSRLRGNDAMKRDTDAQTRPAPFIPPTVHFPETTTAPRRYDPETKPENGAETDICTWEQPRNHSRRG